MADFNALNHMNIGIHTIIAIVVNILNLKPGKTKRFHCGRGLMRTSGLKKNAPMLLSRTLRIKEILRKL